MKAMKAMKVKKSTKTVKRSEKASKQEKPTKRKPEDESESEPEEDDSESKSEAESESESESEQKEVGPRAGDKVEAKDANGDWWSATIIKKKDDGVFSVNLANGTKLLKALRKNIRTMEEVKIHQAAEKEKMEVREKAKAASSAATDAARKKREVAKLQALQEKLAEKMAQNKKEIRRAEKELDDLKDVAKKKAISIGKVKAAKKAALMARKATSLVRGQAAATKAVKSASKRLGKMQKSMSPLKSRVEDAENAMKRAQSKLDDALKRCKDCKKAGDDVPEPGFKDLSAPGAWKSPGLRAAKDRDEAKVALAKAKEVFDKVNTVLASKQETFKAAKGKLDDAKLKRKTSEERLSVIPKRQVKKFLKKAKAGGA